MKRARQAFTVLEFLVVIAIMGILISIVLIGLSSARERSRDDRRIARMQTLAVALEDFASDCRAYPLRLDPGYQCPSDQTITFGQYIDNISDDAINSSTPGSIHYQPLSFSASGGNGCTGYHLYVQLEQLGNKTAQKDSNFDSTSSLVQVCLSDGNNTNLGNPSPTPINGSTAGVYDLRR